MKKFFMAFVMMMVCVLSAVAGNVYKVKYVVIGDYDHGTIVYFTNLTDICSLSQRQFTAFFNSLQAGDLVEVEFKPYSTSEIIAIRKIGYEAPEGMTNGVIVENGNGYGYYGGGYGAASIETKNVGVGYDPNTGIHVRVKGNYVNIPIRFKSRRTNNTVASNDNVVVTAGPATRVVSNESVSTSRQATVRSSQTRRTSSVSAPAKAKKSSSSYDLVSPSQMF